MFFKLLPPVFRCTPTFTFAMRMLVKVLSNPSTRSPLEFDLPLPVMFTLQTSASEEPLFAPCFMCIPIWVCFMDTFSILVSLPPSIEIPSATFEPSIIPPLSP